MHRKRVVRQRIDYSLEAKYQRYHGKTHKDSFLTTIQTRNIRVLTCCFTDVCCSHFPSSRKTNLVCQQRLGSLSLQQTDDEEIELFDWTGIAASAAVTAQEEVTRLTAKLREQQEAVSKLNQQLEDLIKAKSEHEDALLQKFATLINSKKLKIRDQQRLLATAKLDDDAAKEVSQTREVTVSSDKRRAGPSRKGKRKANAKAEPSDEESEDGFEAMQVEAEERAERDEELREAVTPDPSDDETESDDEESAPPPHKKSVRGMLGGEAKAPQEVKATESQGGPSRGKEKEQEVEAPPPRRELPFKAKAQPSAAVPIVDDDETDDEL